MQPAHIEVDGRTGELRRDGVVVRLERQPMAVLALLASRPGELVTHDEIRRAVWGDTHVKLQDSLHYCVRQIRLALGDVARQPRFVETIPRRGYRWLVVTSPSEDRALTVPKSPNGQHSEASTLPASARSWFVGLSVAAALLATTLVIERRPNNHHELVVGWLRTLHDLAF